MILKKINLKDEFKMLDLDFCLEAFCPSNFKEISINRKRKTVLILPGGAYAYESVREAYPVALRLLGYDLNAFVLQYQCKPITFPHPLIEVYAAIAYIRKHAEEFNVDVNSISVMGFSAGGNLACSASAHHHEKIWAEKLNVTNDDIKINGLISGYSVICLDDNLTHGETAKNVSNGDVELKKYFSAEKNVTEHFPVSFIWHTFEDDAVLVNNSILLAKELADHKIRFELHVFPEGPHGESVADNSVYGDAIGEEFINKIQYNSKWIDMAIRFIKKYV